MPNGHGIKRETYVDADDRTFRGLTYDMLNSFHEQVCDHYDKHEVRIEKLEKRKRHNTAASAGSGLIGGFLAMVMHKIFWQ